MKSICHIIAFALTLLCSTITIAHGEEVEQHSSIDIVQSQKEELLRSRNRLLSKVRNYNNEKRWLVQKENEPSSRELQVLICTVCTSSNATLNKTLLEDVNQYIQSGEGNTTEMLNMMLETVNTSYWQNKKMMQKYNDLSDLESNPDYLSTSLITLYAASQQRLQNQIELLNGGVQGQQSTIFDFLDSVTTIADVILSAVITVLCFIAPGSGLLSFFQTLTDLLGYVTAIISAIQGILEIFGYAVLNAASSGRRFLSSSSNSNGNNKKQSGNGTSGVLFPVDAIFPGVPCEINTLLCQIDSMRNSVVSQQPSNKKKNNAKNGP